MIGGPSRPSAKGDLERARRDLEQAHRELAGALAPDRMPLTAWRSGASGRVAPCVRHAELAREAETLLDRLRASRLHRGAVPRRDLLQAGHWRWALTTWALPRTDAPLVPSREEVAPDPDAALRQHRAWCAAWGLLLEGDPVEILVRLHAHHPRFGPLNALEWPRWLAMRTRELSLGAG